MNPARPFPFVSRRDMLRSVSGGFGFAALAGLCGEAAADEPPAYLNPLSPKAPHFTPKAKRVIFLSMRGGPSHVDTFDYKPLLGEHDGRKVQDNPSFNGNSGGRNRTLLGSPWKFNQQGQSGLWISELYPELSKHADELCLVNGMYTDLPNHPQAFLMMHTGEFRFVRPSVGAWTLYGLGTENQNLPGFVSISPPDRFGGAQNYGSAFLPAIYQGTPVGKGARGGGQAAINNLTSDHLSPEEKRRQLDLVQAMNRQRLQSRQEDAGLEGVIESMELGFRMQSALPELLDLTSESTSTLEHYGLRGGNKRAGDFGRQCLMARRLVEAGVRYVECCHEGWDQHNGLKARLTANCQATDGPIAALISDLKARDLLKDTLVIWGGEFGRTPTAQRADGRDHNATGFSMWMAGGGVKGGLRYGATDDYGIAAVENRMHIHDLHATMLHLMGLDHERLTYRYSGRDFRLTNVGGVVAKDIIA